MGQTIKNLSRKGLSSKSIFNNRMVVEICEKVHIHYRNLRILLNISDYISFCKGCRDALDRWEKRGKPDIGGEHIELCRKQISNDTHNDGIQINLNHNLYLHNKGRIFSEGSDLDDKQYIHLKYRDLRLEMTKDEFILFAEAVEDARKNI